MIVKAELENKEFSWNIGRPDLFDDSDRAYWRVIHNLIKDVSIPIRVNNMFYSVDKMLENECGYGGGGYQYRFWFETEDDLKQFQDCFIDAIMMFQGSWCNVFPWYKECEHEFYDTTMTSMDGTDKREVKYCPFCKILIHEDGTDNTIGMD